MKNKFIITDDPKMAHELSLKGYKSVSTSNLNMHFFINDNTLDKTFSKPERVMYTNVLSI